MFIMVPPIHEKMECQQDIKITQITFRTFGN